MKSSLKMAAENVEELVVDESPVYDVTYYTIVTVLLISIAYMLMKIFRDRREANSPPKPIIPALPKLKKRDFTLEELRQYDGHGPEGRVLVSVNGKVFDVTKGKRFYGPGGPYSAFAGHDASRALATFSVDNVKDEHDDLSDLKMMEMDSVREWEMQFTDKYEFVGRLLKPGEDPGTYSDDDDDSKSEQEKSTTEQEKSKDE